MNKRCVTLGVVVSFAIVLTLLLFPSSTVAQSDKRHPDSAQLNRHLQSVLHQAGFTGQIESTLAARLGRPVNRKLANVGRLLWFDTITGLNNDNTCAGCHSPTNGFGDTQSIAIGIQNNGIVGPDRAGPRNMRRSPMIINTAFYPNLMWNSRFVSLSGDPFDNRSGFLFPDPESESLSFLPHLLTAQAFIPPTERTEVAGNDFSGDHDAIRAEVLTRLNEVDEYKKLFGDIFPGIKSGAPITFPMFGKAISEFEFSLTFANAPLDRFARGETGAMSVQEKKGALLFFGQARCVRCHQVSGTSNEMFSDFRDHVIGVPQISPSNTNNLFDGPNANEDYGRAEISQNPADRYKFRTSPLRNVALQAAYMHNGAFTRLEDAIRYHLDALSAARTYSPSSQHLPTDLAGPTGPIAPVLANLDPLLSTPLHLTNQQFKQLVAFVEFSLLDPRAKPANLRYLLPKTVPSGRPTLTFEFPK